MGGPTYTGTQLPAGYRGSVFFADYARASSQRARSTAPARSRACTTSRPGGAAPWTQAGARRRPRFVSFGDRRARHRLDQGIVLLARQRTPPNAVADGTPDHRPRAAGGHVLQRRLQRSRQRPAHLQLGLRRRQRRTIARARTRRTPTPRPAPTPRRLTVDDGRGRTDTATVSIASATTGPCRRSRRPPTARSTAAASTIDATRLRRPTRGRHAAGARPSTGRVTLRHVDAHPPVSDIHGRPAARSFDTGTDHDADSYYEITLTVTDSSGSDRRRRSRSAPEDDVP